MKSLANIGDITKGKIKTSGVSAFVELELTKIKPNPGESLFVVIVFTVWSIARGYGVRRFFNYIHNKNYIQGDR
jgi:hypothetical protein